MADSGYVHDLLRELGFSDFAARTGEFLLVRPLRIVLIVAVAALVARVGARTARRAVVSFRTRAPIPVTGGGAGSSVRSEQRAATLGDVVSGVVRTAVWSMTLLVVLDELGINLAPLIAGAGIAGLALGFGAQSLVKDVISGLFILLEDQYGVGDVVTLGEATGTVEDVTLRVTRLRGADGTVWFVPNGEIRRVGNSSMEWSRALIDVVVPRDADLEAVRLAVLDEAHAFAATPEGSATVLEPPEVWGVQAYEEKGVRVRLLVKTAPRQQYLVARELRVRLTARLAREGIGSGAGETVLVSAGALDQGSPPPPPPAR